MTIVEVTMYLFLVIVSFIYYLRGEYFKGLVVSILGLIYLNTL